MQKPEPKIAPRTARHPAARAAGLLAFALGLAFWPGCTPDEARESEGIIPKARQPAAPPLKKAQPLATLPDRPSFDFGDWHPAADGRTDDGPKFQAMFQQVKQAGGGQVRIPAGTYYIEVSTNNQCVVPSQTEVDARGAVFTFSRQVRPGTVFTWLYDFDVVHFTWKGGRFVGYAFDVDRIPHTANTWHPNAHIRCFHLRTNPGGRTAHIVFDGVETDGIQGTAITVAGNLDNHYTVNTYAEDVTVRGCSLNRTGPFLWDYGFLWQRLVWAHEYDPNSRSLAETYFDPAIFTAPVAGQGSRIEVDNRAGRIPVSQTNAMDQAVCFYGARVDSSLLRGAAYFVVSSNVSHIQVSQTPFGTPVILRGDGVDMKVMYNVFKAFYPMLAPAGSPPGDEAKHGAFMVDAALGVNARQNRIVSGNGDAMLIKISRDVQFTDNVIQGARMGAVWIGDLCENVLVKDNVVDGENGSRVLSVERSCKDVVVCDNLFRNGGRGSWINQPRGILISNNVFRTNTGKNQPDPYKGRRQYQTGEYERWEELYFTQHTFPPYGGQPWGPVVIVQNLIDSGTGNLPPQALRIHNKARDVYIAHNEFQGDPKYFRIESGVETLTFGPNRGILTTNWGQFTLTVSNTTAQVKIPHGLAGNSPFLSCVPTIVPNNPDSNVASVAVTDTDITVTFRNPVPAGRTIDLDWTAYLKWK